VANSMKHAGQDELLWSRPADHRLDPTYIRTWICPGMDVCIIAFMLLYRRPWSRTRLVRVNW